MKFIHKKAFIISIFITNVFAVDIALNGRTLNADGTPMPNAIVTLLNANMTDTTDNQGYFIFNNISTINQLKGNHVNKSQRTAIQFIIEEPNQVLQIRLFTLTGKMYKEISNADMNPGVYRLWPSCFEYRNEGRGIGIAEIRINGKATHYSFLRGLNRTRKPLIENIINANSLGKSAAGAIDTLKISKDGQNILKHQLTSLIGTLPDFYIVQRDIYGSFLPVSPKSIGRIIARVSEDSTIRDIDLWYNSATDGYSGFVYFLYSLSLINYGVYVKVYDDSNKFTGRSVYVPFNNRAGNVNVPSFNPLNACPTVIAGNDTTVSTNDTIKLHAASIDSFGGNISSIEWKINDSPFVLTSTPETTIVAPIDPINPFKCIIRITDNDGNQDTDTTNVNVILDKPEATIISKPSIKVLALDTFKCNISKQFGQIVEYKWDNGIVPGWDDSSNTLKDFITKYYIKGAYTATLYVRDNDGNQDTATYNVTVTNDNPIISNFKDTTISIKDTVKITITATDPEGIRLYSWDINGDGLFDTSTTLNEIVLKAGSAPQIQKLIVGVFDSADGMSKDTASINIISDIPVINLISKDTVIDYNGTISCKFNIKQQFGKLSIDIDTNNSGNYQRLASNIVSFDTTVNYSFVPSNASQWDSVKFNVIDDDSNQVEIGFKMDIRPKALLITNIDSTVNNIAISFQKSTETDFKEYRIYRSTTSIVDTTSELWATINALNDTTYLSTPPSTIRALRYYRVYQMDNEGYLSNGSNAQLGYIKNSPPSQPIQIIADIPGMSIWSTDTIKWHSSNDPNNDSVYYKIMVQNTGEYVVYRSAIKDTFITFTGLSSGSYSFKIVAYDNYYDSSSYSAVRSIQLSTTWVRYYSWGSSAIDPQGICQLNSGNYNIIGRINNQNMFITKISKDGDSIATNVINTFSQRLTSWSISNTIEKDFIIAGDSVGIKAWLMNIDSNGITKWSHVYPNTGTNATAYSVTQTSNGYIAGCGWGGWPYGLAVIVTDINGNTTNYREYNRMHSGNDYPFCVTNISNSSYIFAGATDNRDQYGNLLIFKSNHLGDTSWTVTIPTNWVPPYYCRSIAFDILKLSNGDVIVGSNKDSVGSGVGYSMIGLTLIDTNGNIKWNKQSENALSDNNPRKILLTMDNGYIVCGYNSNPYIFIIKYDSLGNKQWEKRYTGYQYASQPVITINSDNGFTIAGNSSQSTNKYLYVIKTDPNGNY